MTHNFPELNKAAWLFKSYGQPVALVVGVDANIRVLAVVSSARDGDKIRGIGQSDGSYFVPFQRDSANYWERYRKHAGPLGWDRGVLVDGGLFPHIFGKLKEMP